MLEINLCNNQMPHIFKRCEPVLVTLSIIAYFTFERWIE